MSVVKFPFRGRREEADTQEPPKRFRKTRAVVKFGFKSVVLVALVAVILTLCIYTGRSVDNLKSAASVKWIEAKAHLAEKLQLVKYDTRVLKATRDDVAELIKYYSAQTGLNEIIPLSVATQESGSNPFRFRYEPGWEADYRDEVPCPSGWNKEECVLLYSSIGVMQVSFPIWKDFCGVKHPGELFNVSTNVQCGIKILAHCLYDNRGIKDNGALVRLCVRKYNGSGQRAENYASEVIARLAGLALQDKELLVSRVQSEKKNVAVSEKVQENVVEVSVEDNGEPQSELTEDDKQRLMEVFRNVESEISKKRQGEARAALARKRKRVS